MKFEDLLIAAIRRSEIPLRFEPGAEDAVAKPVMELVRAWLEAHSPAGAGSPFEAGQKQLIERLISEIDGAAEIS